MEKLVKKENLRKDNKGKGAGGANTNKSGKAFEKKTDIIKYLEQFGFKKVNFGDGKSDYIYEKEIDDLKITFVQQTGFVNYCRKTFDIDFDRRPDEAFIIKRSEKDFEFKIIEKKNQTVSGTVDSKIYNGPYFIYEYMEYLKDNKNFNFKLSYSYCLSQYFKDKFEKEKKWKITKKYLDNNNIKMFFPCVDTCFQEIFDWLLPNKFKIEKNNEKEDEEIKDKETDELTIKLEKNLTI